MFDELEEARKLKQKMEHTIKSQLEPKLEEHLKKASDQEARSEQARREMSELVAKLRKANKRVAKHKEASENREEVSTYAQVTPAHARARPKRQKSENPRPNTPVNEANGRVWARIFRFLAFWTQSGRGRGSVESQMYQEF